MHHQCALATLGLGTQPFHMALAQPLACGPALRVCGLLSATAHPLPLSVEVWLSCHLPHSLFISSLGGVDLPILDLAVMVVVIHGARSWHLRSTHHWLGQGDGHVDFMGGSKEMAIVE